MHRSDDLHLPGGTTPLGNEGSDRFRCQGGDQAGTRSENFGYLFPSSLKLNRDYAPAAESAPQEAVRTDAPHWGP